MTRRRGLGMGLVARRRIRRQVLAAQPVCQARLLGCTLLALNVHGLRQLPKWTSPSPGAGVLAVCEACGRRLRADPSLADLAG